MPNLKNSFIVYNDQAEIFNNLTNEQAGLLIKTMFTYSTTGIFGKTSDPIVNMAFISIKQQMDRNTQKFNNVCERNKKNIEKRWDTKHTTGISGISKNTKNTDKDKDKDKDISNTSTVDSEYQRWIDEFNRTFKSKYKYNKLIAKQFGYWRNQYNLEEMIEALKKVPDHSWLRDKCKPELLLRQTDTHNNPVDRIGELLSIRTQAGEL